MINRYRSPGGALPLRASIGGPPCSCDQQQRFHRGLPFVGIVFPLSAVS